MDYSQKIINKNIEFYKNLLDEESKVLYRANLIWRLLGEEEFYKSIIEIDRGKDFGWNELMEYDYFDNADYRGIVLFGCGRNSIEFYYQLLTLGYRIEAFCDNNKELIGGMHMGRKVLSVEELVEHYSDTFVIVTPSKCREEILTQLIKSGFDGKNICLPMTGFPCIYNVTKEQYFDREIMKAEEGEVFIDAGSYDGNNILDFVEWCHGDYKKVYAFDPSPENLKKSRENIESKNLPNINFIQAGCFSISKKLKFDNSMSMSGASAVSDVGEMEIDVVSIDDILAGKKATFIKMDIEGSELEALKGACNTIKEYKPKLAICIYHKKEDMFLIPEYIKSIREDYKFYMRKYTPHHGELVLYAI